MITSRTRNALLLLAATVLVFAFTHRWEQAIVAPSWAVVGYVNGWADRKRRSHRRGCSCQPAHQACAPGTACISPTDEYHVGWADPKCGPDIRVEHA